MYKRMSVNYNNKETDCILAEADERGPTPEILDAVMSPTTDTTVAEVVLVIIDRV